MSEAKPVPIPIQVHLKLKYVRGELQEDEATYMKYVPYSNVV